MLPCLQLYAACALLVSLEQSISDWVIDLVRPTFLICCTNLSAPGLLSLSLSLSLNSPIYWSGKGVLIICSLRATKQNHAFSEVVPKGLVQKYRFSDPLSLVRMWLTSQLQKPGAELGRRKNFARTKMTYFSEKIPFWRQKFLMTLLSSQEKHLFYSFRAHIRQHYFSKYWEEDECMGHPPPQTLGGPSPQSP